MIISNNLLIINKKKKIDLKIILVRMGVGDWGLGLGDWGLGIGPNPQSPIPNPQSPIPPFTIFFFFNKKLNIFI